MRKLTKSCCAVALGLWWAVGAPALAQQWAKDMFKTTSHDYGTLARGAKAEFAFTFENLYNEDIQIEKVQTSCGCAGVKYPTEPIKTYQKAKVVVLVDTRSFLGRKDATLTVKFGGRFRAEVPLHVHCYIRSDIVFQPGEVEFGTVKQGDGAKRQVTVSYAGRDDWRITSVRSPQPFLVTQLTETQRGYGRVAYDLSVELKPDAPSGYLSEQLILHTNDADPQKSKVPLAVGGVIKSDLTVRPASLTFLAVCGAKAMKRNVVVQGARPFRVTDITCSDPRIECQLPKNARELHLIPVTFLPGETPGKADSELRIKTDLSDDRVLRVSVHTEVGAGGVDEP